MRPGLVLLGLLFLAACGGGGSTGPPDLFHVGLVGEGSGTGRIHTTQGASVNCLVGQGGSCSLSLASGTELRLEATAGPSSAFLRWGSDASSCGTQPTCSITVIHDLVVAGRFEAEAAGSWSGQLSTATLTLTLSVNNGAVGGTGVFRSPTEALSLTATGTYTPPTISLNLSAQGFQDLNLTATVSVQTMMGTLNGSGFLNEPITLNRQ